jgi:hypothetical protein
MSERPQLLGCRSRVARRENDLTSHRASRTPIAQHDGIDSLASDKYTVGELSPVAGAAHILIPWSDMQYAAWIRTEDRIEFSGDFFCHRRSKSGVGSLSYALPGLQSSADFRSTRFALASLCFSLVAPGHEFSAHGDCMQFHAEAVAVLVRECDSYSRPIRFLRPRIVFIFLNDENIISIIRIHA